MTISEHRAPARLKARIMRFHEYGLAIAFCRRAGADGVLAGARIAEAARGTAAAGEVWCVIRGQDRWHHEPLTLEAISSVCWCGGNLIPVGASEDDALAYAHMARLRGRRCASIVGEVYAVSALWGHLAAYWDAPRGIRDNQPLMEITGPPLVEADPSVRQATMAELDLVAPAAVSMFTEELGFPPPGATGAYRTHVARLVGTGVTYVRMAVDGSAIEFKADLGAILGPAAQVHGVWVEPSLRGRGVATHGVAALVGAAQAHGIAAVSLYVNAFNVPAIAAYEAVGFRRVGTWATVMF